MLARHFLLLVAGFAIAAILMPCVRAVPTLGAPPDKLPPVCLVTGRLLAHAQTRGTNVASFPAAMAPSPDGRWIAVVSVGRRQAVCLLDAMDGHLVSSLAPQTGTAFYAGLAWIPGPQPRLAVSGGGSNDVKLFSVSASGELLQEKPVSVPAVRGGGFIGGVAVSDDGRWLYATQNESSAASSWRGAVSVIDMDSGLVTQTVPTPAFPYAICALTHGPEANHKLYVTSESDGAVACVRLNGIPHLDKLVKTGDHPAGLLLDASQRRLFVTNAGSDTLSVIDTSRDAMVQTLSLRPAAVRQLPGLTPLGMAMKGDTLYVALADMNAVAVVDTRRSLRLLGFASAGWYPTAVATVGNGLYVANAKGTEALNPNGQPRGPQGSWGQHPLSILEGNVVKLSQNFGARLASTTREALANAHLDRAPRQPPSPVAAVRHVIYVIKENRTYDQVLGDMPQGNGDARLTMFGRAVTPNLHALADRFVLLDNFLCCAEVSADGWNWSTAGMISEYTARNVPYYYSNKARGTERGYDFEGTNNGVAVDLIGRPDVARPPAGYLWDLCAAHGVAFRNYGFFAAIKDEQGIKQTDAEENEPTKRVLTGHTDLNYRRFDLTYADSSAWCQLGFSVPNQRMAFGSHHAPSRIDEFRFEFDAYCRNGNLPPLSLLRLPRDHTMGTRRGEYSPRAMVADNDYAVGQLVDMVSHSRYWKDTAIFIVEDDAQNGFDHVDCHRSTCYVVSPYVCRNTVDHRFYNTDSVLRTMEIMLGLPPMCQYDATAPVLQIFSDKPLNSAPFTAITPNRAVVSEVNGASAYRAEDCARFDWNDADKVPEAALNDILWHACNGNEAMPMGRAND